MRLRLLILSLFYLGAAGQQATVKSVVGGAVVPSIGNQTVKPSDITAPSLDSCEVGRVADDSIFLFFSESLNESYTPATSAFSVTGPYGSPAVSAVIVAGDTVIIRLASDTYFGDTVKVSYTKPESNPLQDVRGNQTASWSGDTATNNVGFVTAYQTVYNAYTTKPDAINARYQNLIPVDCGTYWDSLDIFYVFAIHTNDNSEALINWKLPGTYNATLINDPVFAAYQGFTGAATKAVNLNWIPSTNGVNYQLNSASFGCYIRTNSVGNYVDMGCTSGANRWANIAVRYTGDAAYVRVNTATGGSGTAANTDSRGMWIANRTWSANNTLIRNSTPLIVDTDASDTRPDHAIYALALNTTGSVGSPTNRECSMAFAGRGLSTTAYTTITTATELYMDRLGKGVIP